MSHNPVGVGTIPHHLPRVGAGRQPWAGGRNAFGVQIAPARREKYEQSGRNSKVLVKKLGK